MITRIYETYLLHNDKYSKKKKSREDSFSDVALTGWSLHSWDFIDLKYKQAQRQANAKMQARLCKHNSDTTAEKKSYYRVGLPVETQNITFQAV